jgi:prepilin-type N-terminal cleavage/methylation domain-containing protein
LVKFAAMGFVSSTGPQPRQAFSLVELLVVIALVALLAALLLPTLGESKEKAPAIQCLGNLPQRGLAYRMYADDNRDFLPRRGQGVQVLFQIDRPEDWFNALPPYFGLASFQQLVNTSNHPVAHTQSVFICPGANNPGEEYFFPYGMNTNRSPWFLPVATKFAEVVQPASVVAMADAPGLYASTFPSTKAYSVVARHASRATLLFLTGQAQSLADAYVGCGIGDPKHDDVRWLTGTASDTQASIY